MVRLTIKFSGGTSAYQHAGALALACTTTARPPAAERFMCYGPLQRIVRWHGLRLLSRGPGPSFHGLRRMTHNTDLIAVEIAKVCPVIVGMIVRSESGRPFGYSSVGERICIGRANQFPRASGKGDHLAVTWIVGLSVVGLSNHEQWPRTTRAVPACHRIARFVKS